MRLVGQGRTARCPDDGEGEVLGGRNLNAGGVQYPPQLLPGGLLAPVQRSREIVQASALERYQMDQRRHFPPTVAKIARSSRNRVLVQRSDLGRLGAGRPNPQPT